MTDDINRFSDIQTAIIWIAGVKALAGMDRPGNMEDLTWKLIEDGWAVWLRMPTTFGGVSCVAEFPVQMTEREMNSGDWFRSNEQLLSMQTAGSA
jgi:hypothetical protein